MFDAGSRSEALQPRARGRVEVAVARRRGASRLARLGAAGSARCLVPRVPGRVEAVLVNTAGGITGGDRFDWRAEAQENAALTVTTQAAERIYRAEAGQIAWVRTRLTLGPGASLAWLPQETILFDRGALERRLEVEMAPDARLTALEPLVLGRAAMGETVRAAHLVDHWRIRRDGRLVYADTLRLSGPVAEITARLATWGGHRAGASLLHVAPDAGDRVDAVRASLADHTAVEGGASAWDGMLAIRLLAPDGHTLRRAILALLPRLGAVPPRPWTM